MSDGSNGAQPNTRPGNKGKVSFFTGVVGGILVGAIFGNVGAGLAAGIALWLMGALIGKKDG